MAGPSLEEGEGALREWGAGVGVGVGSWGCMWVEVGGNQELGEEWRAGGRRLGEGVQAVGVGSGGRHEGGRAGELVGHRQAAGRRRRGPRSSSWTAGSGSPLQTCRSWWWTSPSCSWREAGVGDGVAVVVAGAQGPGGPVEESGLWGGHWHPQGLMVQPRLRQCQEVASGLEVGEPVATAGEQARFWEF